MTDIANEPPRAHARIVYLGPVSPHWELYSDYGDRTVLEEFRARVMARLVLLPRDDPQFRRNRERIVRDAERERISLEWDLGHPRRRLSRAEHGRVGQRLLNREAAQLARLQPPLVLRLWRQEAGIPLLERMKFVRHLLVEPRRVLPGARRRAEGSGGGRRGRHVVRRPDARASSSPRSARTSKTW